MIRLLFTLIALGLLGWGGWWTYNNVPQVRDTVDSLLSRLDQREAFEVRYEPSQLVRGGNSSKMEIYLYPHLLIETKYTDSSGETREGQLLWDLTDGEMITSTKSWEKTHGFADCLTAGAGSHECEILRSLTQLGGRATKGELLQHLGLDLRTLNRYLSSCAKRQLVVQRGEQYRLHFAAPRFSFRPETELSHPLEFSTLGGQSVPKRFSQRQVESFVRAAFGDDFAIRSSRQVYLPVYRLSSRASDGAFTHTSWNALTGAAL